MGLIKAKGNMYDFVDYHWNVIKGHCEYECSYCYVKSSPRFKNYKAPCFLDLNELQTNLSRKKPISIFVGSKTDMWGPWVRDEQIQTVLEKCVGYPSTTFYFQSKNPARFFKFLPIFSLFESTVYLGTTIETDHYSGFTKAPTIEERGYAMQRISWGGTKTFVTIEPIMSFNLKFLLEHIRKMNPDFVTIGADSKGHGLIEPTWGEVQQLIDNLKLMKIEIRQKKNLDRLRRKK